jgi:putative two-component system response regulator
VWSARHSFSDYAGLCDARWVRHQAVHDLRYRLHWQAGATALAAYAQALWEHGVDLSGHAGRADLPAAPLAARFARRRRVLSGSVPAVDQLEPTDSTVLALVRAVEAKDAITGGHLQRIANLALLLGDYLGLDKIELTALRYGGLLHDVGKIGVDEAILRKQGPLSEAEYRQMQQHPLIGERIVQPLRLAGQIAPIVRGHHERWDGGGYPDGLAGEAIPRGARIVAVLDTYDVLTAPRPYKQIYSQEAALDILDAGAGSQWDPAIVAAVIDCLGCERERMVG